jgi:hypothetical protein
MLEIVRDYAVELLEQASGRASLYLRHTRYFENFCVRGAEGAVGPHADYWLDLLEEEHEDIRTTLRRALDARDFERAVRFVRAHGRSVATSVSDETFRFRGSNGLLLLSLGTWIPHSHQRGSF